MKKIECIAPSETFILYQMDDGNYCCPVCGSPEFTEPPYSEDGQPSFQMCSCDFEFGYDDSPLASPDAIDGIQNNWKKWRRKIIDASIKDKETFKQLEAQLKNIKVRLAFDLIDVQEE